MARTHTLIPRQPCALILRCIVGLVLLLMCFVEGFVAPRSLMRPSHRSLSPSTKLSGLPDRLLAAGSEAASVTSAATATPENNPLLSFFLETLIANAIPAVLAIAVIAFAAFMFRPGKNDDEDSALSFSSTVPAAALYDDLYGDQDQDFGSSSKSSKRTLRRLFGGKDKKDQELPKNTGVPSEQYIEITNLNSKLDSYQYSVTAATQSKAQAAANYRQKAFSRAFGKAIVPLEPHTLQKLSRLEQDFLKNGSKLLLHLQKLQTKLTEAAVDEELHAMGLKSVYELDPDTNITANATQNTSNNTLSLENMAKGVLVQELSKIQRLLQQFELKFIKDVVQAVGPAHATAVRTALLGNIAVRGLGGLLVDLQDRPLSYIFEGDNEHRPPCLYVTRFPGDATASQVADLRQEVTAIVRNARAGDEALVVLQTGGGTVTGYGLAAAQLLRLKEAGLKLTIAVEQVAASGGYMMACIADRIVASPFAVLGSIGVISDIPNVYERLKEEGIEFQTVTAGKYKRTLTPTKKVTREDFQKTKEDVEDIYLLFRDFVAQNRPQLEIDSVATGETWFGQDALDRNLCDELKTVDDVLMDYVDNDFNVYEVKYKPPEKSPLKALVPIGVDESSGNEGLVARGIQWLVRTIASQVRAELGTSLKEKPLQERYMAMDDTADHVRTES